MTVRGRIQRIELPHENIYQNEMMTIFPCFLVHNKLYRIIRGINNPARINSLQVRHPTMSCRALPVSLYLTTDDVDVNSAIHPFSLVAVVLQLALD